MAMERPNQNGPQTPLFNRAHICDVHVICPLSDLQGHLPRPLHAPLQLKLIVAPMPTCPVKDTTFAWRGDLIGKIFSEILRVGR